MKSLKTRTFIYFLISILLAVTYLPFTASAFTNVSNDFETSADDLSTSPLDRKVSGLPTTWSGTNSKINMVTNALGKVGGDDSVLLRALPGSNGQLVIPSYVTGETNKNILAGSDGVYRAAYKTSMFIPEMEAGSAHARVVVAGITIVDAFGTAVSTNTMNGNEIRFQKTDGSQNLMYSVGHFPKDLLTEWSSVSISKNFDKGGQWYSVVFVTEDDKLILYIDGKHMRTITLSNGAPGQNHIKSIEMRIGFAETVGADKAAWMVVDDVEMINSTDGTVQDTVYNPADSNTEFTRVPDGSITIKHPIHGTSNTQANTYAQINGVAQNTSVRELLDQIIPVPGGSAYAVKFKNAIKSNLTAEFLSTGVNDVSGEFATTLLGDSDIVDLDTKIVSKAKDGSLKIYSIVGPLTEVAGGKDTVKNAGKYSLNTSTDFIENVPHYTSAAYFLNQITTNVAGAKKEIKVSGTDASSAFAGIMRPDKTYTLRVTAPDNSSFRTYGISFAGYPLAENSAIAVPAVCENILTSFNITKNVSSAVLEYKNTIGANADRTIAKIENSVLYVGGTPLAHINKNTPYNIKIDTAKPAASTANELIINSVWVNGSKSGENIVIPLSEPAGTGISKLSFEYDSAEYGITKNINGIGDSYQIEYGDTNLTSDFFSVELYNPNNFLPTIRVMPEHNMTVYDMLINPNVYGVRFAPGKIDVHHEAAIKVFSSTGTILGDDREVDEDPERPNTPGNDRIPSMLLPLESGMTLEITSKDTLNKVKYAIKVGNDGPTSNFIVGGEPVFGLSQIDSNVLSYKRTAESDDGTVILVAYNKVGQILELAMLSDDDMPELVDGKYVFEANLDISDLELSDVVFKCMHWDEYDSIIPLDSDVDILN